MLAKWRKANYSSGICELFKLLVHSSQKAVRKTKMKNKMSAFKLERNKFPDNFIRFSVLPSSFSPSPTILTFLPYKKSGEGGGGKRKTNFSWHNYKKVIY